MSRNSPPPDVGMEEDFIAYLQARRRPYTSCATGCNRPSGCPRPHLLPVHLNCTVSPYLPLCFRSNRGFSDNSPPPYSYFPLSSCRRREDSKRGRRDREGGPASHISPNGLICIYGTAGLGRYVYSFPLTSTCAHRVVPTALHHLSIHPSIHPHHRRVLPVFVRLAVPLAHSSPIYLSIYLSTYVIRPTTTRFT